MAVVAVGLVVGHSNETLPEVQEPTNSNPELSMQLPRVEGLDAYYYLAFAYLLGLGPAGEEVDSNNEVAGEAVPVVTIPTEYTGKTLPPQEVEVAAWYSLACTQEFTWECGWVLSIIDCESSWRPRVVGSEVIDGVTYYFYGLLQIYHPDLPGPTNEYLLQPYLNLVEGHIQYAQWQRGERSNPWPNCP